MEVVLRPCLSVQHQGMVTGTFNLLVKISHGASKSIEQKLTLNCSPVGTSIGGCFGAL